MRIGLLGSLDFANNFIEVRTKLEKDGHDVYTSKFVSQFVDKDTHETSKLKSEIHEDVFKEFWELLKGGDAVLVLNYDKRGVNYYIGGNTLIEMAYAHILGQKIYLLNPIPEIQFYHDEISLMKPVILNNNLDNIPKK